MAKSGQFVTFIQSIFALPLFPPGDVFDVYQTVVRERFEKIKKSGDPVLVANMANIQKFENYFHKTWIGLPADDKDSPPTPGMFSILHWNHYDAALKDLPRTNNSSEGKMPLLYFDIFILLVCLFYKRILSRTASKYHYYLPTGQLTRILNYLHMGTIILFFFLLGFNSTWASGLPKNARLWRILKMFVTKVRQSLLSPYSIAQLAS
jgi:hypothetical protein